jgi:hypothetical protein
MIGIVFQKIINVAVHITALTVAVATIGHGDLALGILIVLGQVQSVMGHQNAHATNHEAQHLTIHKENKK